MDKLDGRVFQQLTPWLVRQGVMADECRSARSGAVTLFDKQLEGVEQGLDKCNLSVLKKVARQQRKFGQKKGVVHKKGVAENLFSKRTGPVVGTT